MMELFLYILYYIHLIDDQVPDYSELLRRKSSRLLLRLELIQHAFFQLGQLIPVSTRPRSFPE